MKKPVALTKGKPMLTVGDTAGYAQRGVLLNLYRFDNYYRFEVYLPAVQSSGLHLSAKLLKLARVIRE